MSILTPQEVCRRASLFLKDGFVRRARLILEDYLQENPEDPLLPLELGRLYQQLGMLKTALSCYERCPGEGTVHALRSYCLQELGRGREAWRAWLRFLEHPGEGTPAEIAHFVPYGMSAHNYDIRYGTMCLEHRQPPCVEEVPEILQSFLNLCHEAGWPLAAVVPSHPEAELLAAELTRRLELRDPGRTVRVAWDADHLEHKQFSENELTFAVFGRSMFGPQESAPDILGARYDQKPTFPWPEVTFGWGETRFYFSRWLRSKLQPEAGWQGRSEQLQRQRIPTYCSLVRKGQWEFLGELEEPRCPETFSLLLESLDSAPEEHQNKILEMLLAYPEFDWRNAWELRAEQIIEKAWILSEDLLREVVQLGLSDERPEIRQSAACWVATRGIPITSEQRQTLDLTECWGLQAWLRGATPEEVANCLSEGVAVATLLKRMTPAWAAACQAELQKLAVHPQRRLRFQACCWLARTGQRQLEPLLESWARGEPAWAHEALTALAVHDPGRATQIATELLPRFPWLVGFFLEQSDPSALEFCRQAALGPGLVGKVVRTYVDYLVRFGSDEEGLESLLLAEPGAAARGLMEQGHKQFAEVFQVGLHSKNYDDFAEQLVLWGTTEALEILRGEGGLDFLPEMECCWRGNARMQVVMVAARAYLEESFEQSYA